MSSTQSLNFKITDEGAVSACFAAASYLQFIRGLRSAWQEVYLSGDRPYALELFVQIPGAATWLPVGSATSRPVQVFVYNPFQRNNNHTELWGRSLCAVLKADRAFKDNTPPSP